MESRFILDPIQARTKGEVKRLRRAGFIPVSIQHKGMNTLHFQQEIRPLDEHLRRYGDGALLDLWISSEGRRERVIVQSVHRDPISGRLLQVTFQQVRHDDTLKTHVSLQFTGEPASVQHGEAMVQHRLDRLDIECAQNDLPDYITVNIGHLLPGDVVRVSDLPADPRYKILAPADTVLASLVRPRGLAVSEEAGEVASDVQ